MKYCIYLITLLSLISLIYSACTDGKVNVSGDDTEKCGTAIENCKTYDATSTADTPLCGECNSGAKLIASRAKCLLGCKTESTETAGKCGACNDGYLLLADGLTCLLGCKTEGTGSDAGKCTACNDGYTLSSGACTANKSDDKNNSFSLHGSLLTILLLILF